MTESNGAIDSVAVISGGFDSVTLLHHLVKELDKRPAVLTFLYGQKHSREVDFAEAHVAELGLDEHVVVDMAHLQPLFAHSALVDATVPLPDAGTVAGDPQPATYVPNRNMLFLAMAAAYAESHEVADVYYGAQRHDLYGYWDTTPDFLERINRLFALNRVEPIVVHAPFIMNDKAAILRRGLALGVDYARTWSCYAGGEVACGRCPTCAERLAAFAAVGVADPLPYASLSG